MHGAPAPVVSVQFAEKGGQLLSEIFRIHSSTHIFCFYFSLHCVHPDQRWPQAQQFPPLGPSPTREAWWASSWTESGPDHARSSVLLTWSSGLTCYCSRQSPSGPSCCSSVGPPCFPADTSESPRGFSYPWVCPTSHCSLCFLPQTLITPKACGCGRGGLTLPDHSLGQGAKMVPWTPAILVWVA